MLFCNLKEYDAIFYIEDGFQSSYFHYPIHINYSDILSHMIDH